MFTLVRQIDPIATYAALLSTIVAIWNFYQWWIRGPKLVGRSNANMRIFGGYSEDNNTYITMNVSNRGSSETTITVVGLHCYLNYFQFLRHRPIKTAVVNHATMGYDLPYKLAPGHEFRSMLIQNSDIVELSRSYRLYGCLFHSMSDRPAEIRIYPIRIGEKSKV